MVAAYLDKTASLTPEARRIICDKQTETPHSGAYNHHETHGTYMCRRCGLALFRAHSQFTSGCGWPSFDESIQGNVQETLDADGRRMEILCLRCHGHLGHVFTGERFTGKNKRYCVNSQSLDFVAHQSVKDSGEAILAGGCFWGVDYYLARVSGVLKVESGYIGGVTLNPTYELVCSKSSGHYEAVRVLYDKATCNYYTLLKRFFEIHDPTQTNGQGPDLGPQYHSAVFYYNGDQKHTAEELIHQLKNKGYDAVTKLLPVETFWPAESYHQNYYAKTQRHPYCHHPVLRFK